MPKNNIVSLIIGTALEFYDFALFGLLLPIISKEFMPDHRSALTFTTMIFALGFFMRPIGAIILGYISDNYGRNISLYISMITMSCSSLIIGLLPSYQNIGITATLTLVLCRIAQGLSLGGEQSIAAISIMEQSTVVNRGKYSALVFSGIFIGAIMSIISVFFCISGFLGWRFAFIIGFMVGGVGIYIRYKLKSPIKHQRVSLDMIWDYKPQVLIALCIGGLSGTLGYTQGMVFNVLLTMYLNVTMNESMVICVVGYSITLCFTFLSGYLSDRYGPYKILAFATVTFILIIFPIFWLLQTSSIFLILLAQIFLGIMNGMYNGSVYLFLFSLFPKHFRSTGISTGFALGVSIFGSTTPLISTLIIEKSQISFIPIYHLLIASIALWSVLYTHVKKVSYGE